MSGQTTCPRAVVQALAGLGIGVGVLWLVTAVLTLLVGRLASVHLEVAAGLYLAVAFVASAAMFLPIGAVTSHLAPSRRGAAGTTIAGSSVEQVFTRLGAPATGTRAFLGVVFVIVAVVVAVEAATQVSATRAEEATGRLDHLVAGTVAPTTWLAGRLRGDRGAPPQWRGRRPLLVDRGGGPRFEGRASRRTGGGTRRRDARLLRPRSRRPGDGTRPRRAAVACNWAVLVELVGVLVAQSHWVLDTYPFHQVAAAPAVPPTGGSTV